MPAHTDPTPADHPSPTEVVELCVNLDDATGEVVGDATTRLLDAGALDVWTTPIMMKKQRPGVMLSLLCAPQQSEALTTLMLQLTGSFGVRHRAWQRTVLEREHIQVDTRFGKATIKVGKLGGKPIVARCEYEDAAKLAQSCGITPRQALAAADAAAQAWLASHDNDS